MAHSAKNNIHFESVDREGVRYAEIIWADSSAVITQFCSPDASSMQLGIVAHGAGFVEAPHYHKEVTRNIKDLQQVLFVKKGSLRVKFFEPTGSLFHQVDLKVGDTILLVNGSHSIEMLEDTECVSVKQGPFLGVENDKINIVVRS